MSVLGAITSLFESDDGPNEETFGYRCRQCDARFDRRKDRMRRVACPECGSADVAAVDQ